MASGRAVWWALARCELYTAARGIPDRRAARRSACSTPTAWRGGSADSGDPGTDASGVKAFDADDSALYMLDRPVVEGRANITEWLRRTTERYEWVVQLVHSGIVRLDGDRAFARWQITETQLINDGSRRLIVGRYEDTMQRFPEGWKFVQRKFTARYMGPFDMSADSLPDSPPLFPLWR